MKHKLTQNQRILLKLALTPQMKQSIQLLGMSTQDLQEYVETAVEANPFLKKRVRQKSPDEFDYKENIRQEENQRLNLISQIRMLGLKDKALEIAEYLIYAMDDNGYITDGPEEVAEALSADIEEVEKTLEVIQGLEPPGIGARDVRECLQLQLERKGLKKSLEYAIVTDFINELARNDVDKISKALKADKEKVKTAVNNIKKLNPRPASTILSKEAQKVIPDLIAEFKDKGINLMLNRDWLPQLRFYNAYENEDEIAKDLEAKKFIKENINSAKFLIDNLKRREETIYKVAKYILDFQLNSLTRGNKEIDSLTIKEIAEGLKMHPSTISRTISNKYVQLNGEVTPLKAFLSKGMQKKDGEIISKTNIKNKIEMLIKNENRARPLSDEDIRKTLEGEGIVIERRTLAKYRNSLRILPAYLRRKVEPSA